MAIAADSEVVLNNYHYPKWAHIVGMISINYKQSKLSIHIIYKSSERLVYCSHYIIATVHILRSLLIKIQFYTSKICEIIEVIL